MEEMKIGIAIPNWNRDDVLFESFANVYHDERVKQIVISDDASDINIFHSVREKCLSLPKVFLTRNLTNQDCFKNKRTAVSYSDCEWNILLDSDNSIDKTYLDILFSIPEWDEKTIYTPSFAMPHFDFRQYEGVTLTKENIAEYIDKPLLETCLNASNYFINKKEWLRVWDGSTDPVTSDSIWTIYNWLKEGNKLLIVPGLHYQHRVWKNSHYQNNVNRTPPGFHEEVLKKIRSLK
jgi:hypothetical protein